METQKFKAVIDYISTCFPLSEHPSPNTANGQENTYKDWQGLRMSPIKIFTQTARNKKEKVLGNLRIVEKNGQTPNLCISNSLHKAAHYGVNHTDFFFSELEKIINQIGEILKLDFSAAYLKGKFEFGVNLVVDEPERVYMAARHRNNYEPDAMRWHGKKYGISFSLTDYTIKVYSPVQKLRIMRKNQLGMKDNILRFEVSAQVSYLRQRGVKLNRVEHLLEIENLQRLGQILTNNARQLWQVSLPPTDLVCRDLKIWYFFNHATKEELMQMRKEQKSTFYRERSRFKDLQGLCKMPQINLGDLVEAKWQELLAG